MVAVRDGERVLTQGTSCEVCEPPDVTRVSGCTDAGDATGDCATAGGTTLTLYGASLGTALAALTVAVFALVRGPCRRARRDWRHCVWLQLHRLLHGFQLS